MNNKVSTIKYNNDDNQIIDEIVDGGGKTQTVKYGLIKLMGDKTEHRVSFKTLLAITEADKNEAETIMIKELGMVVKLSQIVMMRSETETARIINNFTNLPTTNLYLTLDFKILDKIRTYFDRNKVAHYLATAHYTEIDGERQYILEKDKIQKLLKVEYDADGHDYISEEYEYGVQK